MVNIKSENGFTFIEILLVVSIIAILLAVAVSTFIGVKTRGQDAIAKMILKNAALAVELHYANFRTYATASGTTLAGTVSQEVNITLKTSGTADATQNEVLITPANPTSSYTSLATKSGSGTTFEYIKAIGEIAIIQ